MAYNSVYRRLGLLAAVLVLSFTAACGGSGDATPGTGGNQIKLAGQVDTSFGAGGKATVEMGDTEELGGMVVQPDGKMVLAGTARPGENTLPRFALARFTAEGKLDTTFGEGGKVYTQITDPETDYSGAQAIALQPDGKIVAAGDAPNREMYHNSFAIVRYMPDGSLDTTFGDGGKVIVGIATATGYGNEDKAEAVAVQADGKIVVGGDSGSFPVDFAVARLNADGSLDTTFGDGGKVVVDFGFDDHLEDLKIDANGKILLAGYGGGNPDWAIARLNADGSLDSSFGEGGKILKEINGGQDWANAIIPLPDGKILAGGFAQIGSPVCGIDTRCEYYGFAVAQFNADGSMDKSFGDDGVSNPDFIGSASGYAMVRRPDGKIILGGHKGNQDFAVVAFNADGSVDRDFSGGMVTTDFAGYIDRISDLGLTPDGKVIAAGVATTDPNDILDFDFALVRYK